jgi:hypothetical protein
MPRYVKIPNFCSAVGGAVSVARLGNTLDLPASSSIESLDCEALFVPACAWAVADGASGSLPALSVCCAMQLWQTNPSTRIESKTLGAAGDEGISLASFRTLVPLPQCIASP